MQNCNVKMPRNSKKKTQVPPKQASDGFGSEDDMSVDNESLYSYTSEAQQGGSLDGKEDEVELNEKFEEKLMQAMENATEKSAQTRTLALQNICEILMQRYMPEFVDDRKITLMDLAEKGVKRGKGPEQAVAARLAALLIIHIGGDEAIVKQVTPLFLTIALDPAANMEARAKCCLSLGLLNFLGNDDLTEILAIMKSLEQIFSGSYLKGDNSPSAANANAATLHSAALSAWGLLLTLLPPSEIAQMQKSHASLPSIKNLMGLLNSPHLDVRMAAGEMFALVFEAGQSHDEDFMQDYLPDLIDAVKKLATDSQKFRAKKDRKMQRATFRDVLHFLEEDESPEINVRFGRESLLLDTWAMHHQYMLFCTVMGPGINRHLAENELVRDVLQLGARLTEANLPQAMTKAEKKFINAEAFKARTKIRSKNRDKRSAVIA